jgi:hypothetical protein
MGDPAKLQCTTALRRHWGRRSKAIFDFSPFVAQAPALCMCASGSQGFAVARTGDAPLDLDEPTKRSERQLRHYIFKKEFGFGTAALFATV